MPTEVILVHSFKGGTGKTLISINLADFLVQQGNRVLLIESDFVMPAFSSIFDKYEPDIFFNDFLNTSETNLDNYIYPDTERDLGIICCDSRIRVTDKINSKDQEWFRQKKKQLEVTIDNINYDYVIFDGQPSMHLFTINTIVLANHIALILRPDIQSINGTKQLLDNIYSRSLRMDTANSPEFSIIFNQVPRVEQITPMLETWSSDFRSQYNFINRVGTIYYQDSSSYATAQQQFMLNNQDKTKQEIGNLFSYMI